MINVRDARQIVASYSCHRKTGNLVSVSQMAAFAGESPEWARRTLMLAVMDGTMRLVKSSSSGGSLVCQVISQEDAEYNALSLRASTLSECSRIQRIADSM